MTNANIKSAAGPAKIKPDRDSRLANADFIVLLCAAKYMKIKL